MEGEANRVLQLTANAVVPISYIVPRKVFHFHSKGFPIILIILSRKINEHFRFVYQTQSYREFHADLFPETAGSEAPIYASQWMTGTNASVDKILLDPTHWQGKNLHVIYIFNNSILAEHDCANVCHMQIIRGPLSQRKEEPKVVKTVPTPKPRKSISDEVNLPSNNIFPKVGYPQRDCLRLFINTCSPNVYSLLSHLNRCRGWMPTKATGS